MTQPKRLLLPDGKTSDTITEYFVTPLATRHHQELCFFYLTDLGKDSPLILGISWLQLHNPSIDWPALKLTFTSDYCRYNCLPPNIPRDAVVRAPPGHTSRGYRPPSIEDCPDEQAPPLPDSAPVLHIAGSLTPCQPHYHTHNPHNATGPECRALMISTPLKLKPRPTEMAAVVLPVAFYHSL